MKKIIITSILTGALIICAGVIVPLTLGYKIVYLTTVNYDYNVIAAWGQWAGVAITALLTLYIILQTKQLNISQQRLQADLYFRQEEIQRRQIKIELYKYRMEVFELIEKIFNYADTTLKLADVKEKDDLNEKAKMLTRCCKFMKDEMNHNVEVLQIRKAEYVFTQNINQSVKEICEAYTNVIVNVTVLDQCQQLNMDLELGCIDKIVTECKKIISYRNNIYSIMETELNISKLERC